MDKRFDGNRRLGGRGNEYAFLIVSTGVKWKNMFHTKVYYLFIELPSSRKPGPTTRRNMARSIVRQVNRYWDDEFIANGIEKGLDWDSKGGIYVGKMFKNQYVLSNIR